MPSEFGNVRRVLMPSDLHSPYPYDITVNNKSVLLAGIILVLVAANTGKSYQILRQLWRSLTVAHPTSLRYWYVQPDFYVYESEN